MTDMMIEVPDISAARAARVLDQVLTGAARHQARVRRRRVAGVASAAVAASVAGVLGVSVLLTPTSSFASWTPVPTALAMDLEDAAVSRCIERAENGTAQHLGIDPTGLRPVLGEQRGAYKTVLLAGGGGVTACISGPPFAGVGLLTNDAETYSAITTTRPLPVGESLVMIANGGQVDGSGPRYVFGQVGTRVRSVAVATEHRQVFASVVNGYFVAWWPAPDEPVRITTHTATGAQLDILELKNP